MPKKKAPPPVEAVPEHCLMCNDTGLVDAGGEKSFCGCDAGQLVRHNAFNPGVVAKVLLILCLLVLPLPAEAQADTAFSSVSAVYHTSATRAFDVAEKLRGDAREDQAYDMYNDARKLFETAYALYPTSEIAFNIALCYWRIDAAFASQRWLKKYYRGLRRGEQALPDADRLTKSVIAEIDFFEADIHYEFACDEKKRICLYSTNWGK